MDIPLNEKNNYTMIEEVFNEPFLLILIGNIGTGKSTISKYINSKFKSTIINGDEFKEANKELSRNDLDMKFYLLVENELMNHRSVILDGQNLIRKYRAKWIRTAKRYNMRVVAIDCGSGNIESLSRRLFDNRGESSVVWKQEYENSKHDYEIPSQDEEFDFILESKDINITQ
jgi:predicted kinase